MLERRNDGLFTMRRPVEENPEKPQWPDVPIPWPPSGPSVRYCTIEEAGSDDIHLKNGKGETVCLLAQICTDFRPFITNNQGPARVTVGSATRIFCRHNQWVEDDDDPASWTPEIRLAQLFYDRGHFDDKAHEYRVPLGWTVRICGRDMRLQQAFWPSAYGDVKAEHLWLNDPLPTFDRRGYLELTWDPRLSGYCGP